MAKTYICICGAEIRNMAMSRHNHEQTKIHAAWVAAHPLESQASAMKQAEAAGGPGISSAPIAGIFCEDCGGGPLKSMSEVAQHTLSRQHQTFITNKQAQAARMLRLSNEDRAKILAEELPPDLAAAVTGISLSPQDRAKMVRGYFSAQGWPNAEHPGTVLEFLQQYEVPVVEDRSRPLRKSTGGITEMQVSV